MKRLLLIVSLAGCAGSASTGNGEVAVAPVAPSEPDPVVEHEEPPSADWLSKIARDYAGFTKVTDAPRAAPTLCAAPPDPSDGQRMSRSEDAATHGKKMYHLFVSHAEPYLRRTDVSQPADQILVKEAWTADHQPAGLFVMARRGEGWEFGFVAPDGALTTEGTSCHGCHDGQPDGLFGLSMPPSSPQDH